MKYEGTVYVEATLTFKGNIDLILWNDMQIGEVISEIIDCDGNYEYEVVRGSMVIEDEQPVDDWEDYNERA